MFSLENIILGSLASLFGFGFFTYGKKMQHFKSLLVGVLLMIIPIFMGGMPVWQQVAIYVGLMAFVFVPIG
jgi:hypothetical protein